MKLTTTPGRNLWRWLLLLMTLPLGVRAQTVPPGQGLVADSTELRVLRQFYYATGGPQWYSNSYNKWLTGTTLTEAGGWDGVRVENGDVTGLSPNINASTTGALPDCLSKLRSLRMLRLNQHLTGIIPSSYGQLTKLETLDLGYNQLTGPIPATLSALSQLKSLNLSLNQLSGALPTDWGQSGKLALLNDLRLDGNKLTGSLPPNWGNLKNLQIISLDNNQLTGVIPAAWSGLNGLHNLSANSNQLIGPLPGLAGGWQSIETISLSNNKINGPLPPIWSRLSRVYYIALSINQLSGSLPAEWGGLANLTNLSLENNLLIGELPDSLRNLKKLTNFTIYNNRLSGSLTPLTGLTSLQSFQAGNNRFTGALPANLAQLTNLRFLDLGGNQLSGPLPATLGTLSSLQFLYLSYNKFTGPLPINELLKITTLSQLNLNGNHFTGTLPVALLNLPNLQFLYVNDNDLTNVESPVGLTNRLYVLNLLNNQLDYGALERLYRAPQQPFVSNTYTYTQRVPSRVDTVRYQVGSPVVLQRTVGGLHNYHYQWQRLVGGQWTNIPGDTLATHRVSLATAADQGTYRLAMGNRWFTRPGYDVTQLYSAMIYADMIPYPVLARNLPVDANQGLPVMAPLMPTPDAGAARPTDVNFVRVFTPRVALTKEGRVPRAPVDSISTSTQYLDGLGRPLQTVLRQASPSRRDMVQPQAYDALGREPRQYLPYADSVGGRGGYRYRALTDQQQFYARTGPVSGGIGPLPPGDPTRGIARTGVAYAETLFESSPLNRVVAQGAAGEAWQLTSGHVQERQERPNTALDSIPRFVPGYGPAGSLAALDPGFQGYYAPGELWGTEVADVHGPAEPGAHGYRTLEWKNKLGQVVLRQVEASRAGAGANQRSRWLRTAYAYDDLSHLRFVLQPEATRRLRGLAVGAPLPASAAAFIFRYRYDGRGRSIAKLVPGQDAETLVVFDALDRPILSQDANQRDRGEWSWSKYDALGRVVLTGLVQRAGPDREALQAEADQAAQAGTPQWEQRTALVATYPQYLTTDQAYPRLGQGGFGVGLVLTASYYDDYNFDNDAANKADATFQVPAAALFPTGPVPAADALRTLGLPTRSLTRVLNRPASDPGADWLSVTTFYDERARPVQVQSTNARGGADVVTTQLNFAGQPTRSVTTHNGPKLPAALQVIETMAYDHTGRLLSTSQQVPGETQPVEVARVQYNELGQVLGKTLAPGTRLLQQVDYTYNIRGWLTRLNDPYFPVAGDLFSLSLHYETGFSRGYEQYNGNLTGQTWRGRGGVQRAYGYVYDPLNRLLQGDYVARVGAQSTSGPWTAEQDNFRLAFVSYDDNGNILTLRRRGLLKSANRLGPAQYGPVDALSYAYQGNRLQAVDDAVSTNQLPRPLGYNGAPTSLAGDFQELASARTQPWDVAPSQDYRYDPNGNLTQDRNKGITGIQYNFLNLPRQIQFGFGADSVVFRYAASGQKTAKLVYQTGKPLLRTDYLGPYQYEQDSLRFFPHAEGRVLRLVSKDAAGQVRISFAREFTLKDHLGNLRLAYRLGAVRMLTATLEQDATTRKREPQQFDSLSVSKPVAFLTTLARTGTYAAKLNASGATPQPLGPLAQLAVQAGDTITVTAPGLYQKPVASSGFWFSLGSFLAGLFQHPANTPAPDPSRGRKGLPLLQVGVATGLTSLPQLSGGVPKGYVRLLVFGPDSALISQQTQQLSTAALNSYEPLRLRAVVPQDGYVTAYVGNESDVDVFFDDVTIEHRPGLQVQENQYDPWGLSLAGLDYTTPTLKLLNMKQFNSQDKIADLGLGLYLYRYREYDPQLGRFSRVDPLAEKFPYLTPYQFASDSPIWLRELEGLEGIRYTEVNGNEGVRKNVVVLLEPLKQIKSGASQKQIDRTNRQNARIEQRNTNTIARTQAEVSQYLDNNGAGTKDSNGNTIHVTTNIIGIPDFDKTGMTRSQINNKYTEISRAYGQKGTKFDQFGGEQELNANAAVITREGSGSKQGVTTNNIIRVNFDIPQGGRSHEIGHSLGLDDNGYKSGGILNNPPAQLISSEVDVILKESYQLMPPPPPPPALP